MEIHVKPGQLKIDPKDPKSNPDYGRRLKKQLPRFEKMRFESDGHKRDYLRAVKANPNNIPGGPAFYPPLQIRTVVPGLRELTEEEKEKVWKAKKRDWTVHDTDLYCKTCNRESTHSISNKGSFCKKCGRANVYHC